MQATGVYVMNFLPKPAEGVARHRAHALVSPQRRLRRDRLLPRRFALRHPDAAGADHPCAARGSPRRAGEGAGAGAPQVRRILPRRLAGDRHRHPPPPDRPRQRCWRTTWANIDKEQTLMKQAVKHEYERIPYLVAFQNNSGVRDVYGGVAETHRAGELSAQAERQAVGHRAGVHAPDRRRGLPADDQRAGPGRPSRHLLQQPVPRHRLGAVDGEGRRGSRRVHQGRQEPAGLRQGGAGRVEWRRLAVGVLPAAGPAPDDHVQPVRRRPRPDQARPDPPPTASCCWPRTSAGTAR